MSELIENGNRRRLFPLIAALLLVSLACGLGGGDPTQVPVVFTEESATQSGQDGSGQAEGLPTAAPDLGSTLPTSLGQDIPIAGAEHIDENDQPADWNSDPPTSGQHYSNWVRPGFYAEPIPDGYLIHNMEHGYVIIYFNCDGLNEAECERFQAEIEAAMAEAGLDEQTNSLKIVAVPRPGMGNPITYASWGHLYKAETFLPEELVLYVQIYRSNPDYAPEWNLP